MLVGITHHFYMPMKMEILSVTQTISQERVSLGMDGHLIMRTVMMRMQP